MNVINISKRKFNSLNPLQQPDGVFSTESDIFEFNYRNQQKILKTLFFKDGEIFANKLYTIEMLNSYKECLPDNLCIPDNFTAINKEIMGFTVPKVEGVNLSNLLQVKALSSKKQLLCLKKVGEILEKLKQMRENTSLKQFYLNDLHDSNFIVTPDMELKVVDLDSCKIGNNCAFVARFLTPFSLLKEVDGKYQINQDETKGPGYVIADENSDLYCYIIVILNYLTDNLFNFFSKENFYNYLTLLNELGFNQELLHIIEKILTSSPNENPCELLETISDKQVDLSREKVKLLLKNLQ